MIQRVLAIVLVLFIWLAPAWAGDGALPATAAVTELLSAGRIDEAIRALGLRLKGSPSDGEAYHLLSRSYYAVGRWDDAIKAGERAVSLQPNSSAYHLWLGRAFAQKADHASFVTAAQLTKNIRQEFERAVELDGANVDARSDLGEYYLEAPSFLGGGKEKARQQAEAIAQRNVPAGHWLKARIAEKDKKTAEAEQEYRAAIASSGNEGTYWLNLASFYKRAGRLNEMENAVSTAVQSDKKKPDVFFDAAQILFGAGRNFPGAAQYVRQYLVVGPTEQAPAFHAHYLLGAILEKQGDEEGAASEYRAALSLAKDYSRAGDALHRLERR